MVGFGLHLGHDIHPQADHISVTLGAVPRQTETGMSRYRFIFMTGVAWISAGMAVCKTVFVTFGAARGGMMRTITVGGGVILTA